jgi:large subunit ribosomal protein L10
MLHSDKQKVIEGLKERIDRMTALVLTDYEGIDVESMNVLRSEFRKAGVEYTVVKNTLIRIAMEGMPYAKSLEPHLSGMTALAWTYDDPGAPARVIRTFHKTLADKPAIKCGIIGETYLDGADVAKTADLPNMDQARAMLLSMIQAPARQILTLLQAPARDVAGVIAARQRSMEEAG